MGKIDNKIKCELIKSYAFRLKVLDISFSYGSFKEVFEKLSISEINRTLKELLSDKKKLVSSLNKLGIKASVRENINTLADKIMMAFNISNITSFSNNKKNYFKFNSTTGEVFVLEYNTNNPHKLFVNILNQDNHISNIKPILEQLNKEYFTNVSLESSSDINVADYPRAQMTIVSEIEKQFSENKVLFAPQENIYIVKGNEQNNDIVLSVSKYNGRYKVSPLVQVPYGEQQKELTNDGNSNNKNKQRVFKSSSAASQLYNYDAA